jgi:ABC-type phosphate/phosphonate transport system substrate-binding protein
MIKNWAKPLCLSIILLFLILQACSTGSLGRPEVVGSNPGRLNASSPTPLPTFTPTPAPLGSLENPIAFGLIASQNNQEQKQALDQMVETLQQNLNLQFTYQLYSGYFELEEAILNGQVGFTFIGPIEYLIGSQKDFINTGLISTHAGVKSYGTQFFANKETKFQTFFDLTNNTSNANQATALRQFNGTKGCFISENSLAGYWVPMGYLKSANIPVQAPVFTQSSAASLRSLYIQGICQFAVTYSSISDPRTASIVINDLPDILDKVPIIWSSPPVIPNRAISYSRQLELPLQTKISEFLIQFSNTTEGRQLISLAMDYEINGLSAVPDSLYDPLRDLLKVQEIRLSDLLEQP